MNPQPRAVSRATRHGSLGMIRKHNAEDIYDRHAIEYEPMPAKEIS